MPASNSAVVSGSTRRSPKAMSWVRLARVRAASRTSASSRAMPRARAASSSAATVGQSATLPAAPGAPALETSLDNSGSSVTQSGAEFSAREVLRLAWPLFQETLLRCLPLGVLAAAASDVPNAEGAARRAAGLPHYDREWWMLLVAVT